MKQDGFTLIEVVVATGLLAIIMSFAIMTTSLINNARFNKAVSEVAQVVEYARQATALTGIEHNIRCFSNRVVVKKGVEKPIYTVHLGEDVYISDGCTGKKLFFRESMAVVRAGTIELISRTNNRSAEITVSIATGKVTTKYIR